MSACATRRRGAPIIALTLVRSGEPLLRLEKRLHCVAAGAGMRLDLEIRKDGQTLGVPFAQTPAVVQDRQVVLNGLPRTEAIETWLRQSCQFGNKP